MSEPVKAWIFPNGNMIVFDGDGQQVPEYQGTVYPNLVRLQSDYPNVVVRPARWDGSQENPIVPMDSRG